MKTKYVTFFGQTEQGVFAQALFGQSMEKMAGAAPFSDWETGEKLKKFLKTITPEDRKENVYVLVNALGAGEYFGSNINADYFPWDALSHEGDDYGYKTFLRAHAFQHHANKDPERAFGVPVLSILNPRMKRVELVIKLNREAAKRQGADGIITRIENGEFPDVSMGCKVPYDVCSICSHQSKTRDDYCEHMRPPEDKRHIYGPNKILEDGRRIYVINLHPRFFDISFVFIGADKTAKVMAKLASKGSHVCLGSVCALPNSDDSAPALYDAQGDLLDPRQFRKVASVECNDRRGPCGRLCAECADRDRCGTDKLAAAFKVASHKKLSEMVKDVPAGVFSMKKLPALEREERDIHPDHLDELAKKPLRHVLGGATRMGIILKPHEFQRVVLRRMGEDDLIRKLDRHHHVFRQVRDFDTGGLGKLEDPLDAVFEMLKAYIKERTSLGTPFQIRVMIAGRGSKNALPTREPIGHSLLDKVSAAYNGYRRSVLKKLSHVVDVVREDPKLRDAILGDGLSRMFTKTATSDIISPDTVKYALGAHLQDRSVLCDAVAGAAGLDNQDLLKEIFTA